MATISAPARRTAREQCSRFGTLVATIVAAGASWLAVSGAVHGQQIADTSFAPRVSPAAFEAQRGPRVAIDEGHFNFHTADERYAPFARLLQRDGFVVSPSDEPFTAASLATIDILVIANALNERNVEEWALPTPSAFTAEEILAVREWVNDGGALLLIADHMPFGGAAAGLAGEFGILFTNGYASRPGPLRGTFVFNRTDGSLKDHPITRGRGPGESIDRVTAFTGQAFSSSDAEPIFELADDTVLLMPTDAGQISAETPRVPAGGKLQGATLRVGKGRIAAFGEAAMFSAQLAGPAREPMGMNSPGAEQNAQFVLNVLHWLAGLLRE